MVDIVADDAGSVADPNFGSTESMIDVVVTRAKLTVTVT